MVDLRGRGPGRGAPREQAAGGGARPWWRCSRGPGRRGGGRRAALCHGEGRGGVGLARGRPEWDGGESSSSAHQWQAAMVLGVRRGVLRHRGALWRASRGPGSALMGGRASDDGLERAGQLGQAGSGPGTAGGARVQRWPRARVVERTSGRGVRVQSGASATQRRRGWTGWSAREAPWPSDGRSVMMGACACAALPVRGKTGKQSRRGGRKEEERERVDFDFLKIFK